MAEPKNLAGSGLQPALRNKIFISYSHEDRRWLDELLKTLRPYRLPNEITIWADTELHPGDRWREAIDTAQLSTKVAVLLVSRNFFASKFINEVELPAILEAEQHSNLRLFWIAVSASGYKQTELRNFQSANEPSHPLDEFENRPAELSRELVKICDKLVALLNTPAQVPDAPSGNGKQKPATPAPANHPDIRMTLELAIRRIIRELEFYHKLPIPSLDIVQLAFKGLTEILNSLRRLKQIAPSQNLSPAFITELNETFRYTSEVRASARNLVSMLKTTRRPSRKKLIPLLEEVDVGMMEVQTRLEALLEKLV